MDIYFYPSEPSCDIAGGKLTKQNMLARACKMHSMPLEKILFIGDFVVDIGAMAVSGYCACPANAEENVREYVAARNGHVAKEQWADGCLEIFNNSANLGLYAIISDVDGCLFKRKKTKASHAFQVADFISRCEGHFTAVPPLALCTGRSYEQSIDDIMIPYGFTKGNIPDALIDSWPPLMFENGSVLYHPGSGQIENIISSEFPDYIESINAIEKMFLKKKPKLEKLCGHNIILPKKRNTITIEVPDEIRRTPKGAEFRGIVFEALGEICYELDLSLCSIPKEQMRY